MRQFCKSKAAGVGLRVAQSLQSITCISMGSSLLSQCRDKNTCEMFLPLQTGCQQPNQLVERCPVHSVFSLEEVDIFRVVVKVAQVEATIISRCFAACILQACYRCCGGNHHAQAQHHCDSHLLIDVVRVVSRLVRSLLLYDRPPMTLKRVVTSTLPCAAGILTQIEGRWGHSITTENTSILRFFFLPCTGGGSSLVRHAQC